MNLQTFKPSPREMITFGRLLISSISYFPLVLFVISKLKCILLLHQNFGKFNLLMQISFIILFMVDLYKDNHVRACVCEFVNFFFKKNFSSESIDWTFTKFHSIVPTSVKIFSSLLQKNQACGEIQALKRL